MRTVRCENPVSGFWAVCMGEHLATYEIERDYLQVDKSSVCVCARTEWYFNVREGGKKKGGGGGQTRLCVAMTPVKFMYGLIIYYFVRSGPLL